MIAGSLHLVLTRIGIMELKWLDVAQICNLPSRRIAFGNAEPRSHALQLVGVLPITNRRYGRLKICATIARFMESPHFNFDTHWDHEPALQPEGCVPSTRAAATLSSGTQRLRCRKGRFMERDNLQRWDANRGHEPESCGAGFPACRFTGHPCLVFRAARCRPNRQTGCLPHRFMEKGQSFDDSIVIANDAPPTDPCLTSLSNFLATEARRLRPFELVGAVGPLQAARTVQLAVLTAVKRCHF